MNDWLHCNVCIRLPDSNEKLAFFFTSCGHIMCQRCLEKGEANSCRVCSKITRVLEINRSLRPEHQIYFRNPKDLLETYVKNINSVLDFQATHRSRLVKARQDQQKKAAKFVMSAQVELKRRTESEKKALAEKNNLAEEVLKLRQHAKKLEDLIAEQASNGRTRTPGSSRASASSGGSNRERDNHMQFSFVATSTPLSDCLNTHASSTRSSSSKRFAEVFTGGAAEPSPIICEDVLTTPDMLGIKKNATKSGSRMKSGEMFGGNFNFS